MSLPKLAFAASKELLGAEQGAWLKELGKREGDLVKLVSGLVDKGSAEEALQLAGRLAQSWWMTGRQGAMHPLMERVMQLLDQGSDGAKARALAGMGSLEYALGNFDKARELCEQSLPLLERTGDPALLAHTLDRTGMAARQQGRLDDAVQFHTQALQQHRQDPTALAQQALCLNNLGVIEFFRGADLEAARRYHTEALALRERSGDRRGIASSLNNLAQVDRFQGDLEAALPKMQKALELRASINDTWGVAGSNVNLAAVQAGLGRIAEAQTHLGLAVAGFKEVKDTKLGLCESLESGADLAIAQSQPARAVELLTSAQLRREAVGSPRSPLLQRTVEAHLDGLRTQLGDAAFETAKARATTGDEPLGIEKYSRPQSR